MDSFFEYYSNTGWDDLHSQVFGTGHSLMLPVPTLHIPLNRVSTKVSGIIFNHTPIIVNFDNGQQWKLTKKQWDFMKSQGKEPKINQRLEVATDLNGRVISVNKI
jgi:hypothetical protein